MTSDYADDDCRSSSSTATSHEEHTLYNFAMSFFSHRGFFLSYVSSGRKAACGTTNGA
jgi:hypothetical protein